MKIKTAKKLARNKATVLQAELKLRLRPLFGTLLEQKVASISLNPSFEFGRAVWCQIDQEYVQDEILHPHQLRPAIIYPNFRRNLTPNEWE